MKTTMRVRAVIGIAATVTSLFTGLGLQAQTTGEVARPGAYYGDGPWTDWNGAWLGLMSELGGRWMLREVAVSTSDRGPVEVCGDRSMVRTHFSVGVTQDGAGAVQLLLRGFPTLREGSIVTGFSGPRFLLPGESIAARLGTENTWSLTAYGTVRPAADRPEPQFTDYEVWVSGQGESGKVFSLSRLSNDGPPTILWVGDMDRDRRPDVLANVSESYVGSHFVLYLSSLALPGEIVGEAGSFATSGC